MKIIKKINDGVDFLVEWAHRKRFNRYHRMLQYGQIDQLLELGKSEYVITHFMDFRLENKPHTDKEAYAPYAMLVTPAMMRNYLHRNPENFYFFAMHPKGLQILAEQGFSGAIARLEREFVEIAKNFPESFKLTPNSHREYVELVNNYLEAGLPVPE
ncbi:MAG: hypothetical protein IJ677_01355 [Alphaproteobacteria bacterium]|nr:hypothetical protein [Alphaproteobacteria bacterium]